MAKLHFFYSSMNAGKSTALLQSNHNFEENNLSTILFLPQTSKHNYEIDIVSRIGIQRRAVLAYKNFNFLQVVYQCSKYPGINAKFIPEGKILEYTKFQLEHGIKKKYPNIISILIFRPGSIIVTGGNKIEDYISAVTITLNIIASNPETIIF